MVDLSDEFLNLTEGKCFMLDRMGKLLVPAVLAGLLAGCGGSDAPVVERPPEASKSISVAGKVIDGYVVGATVWLDLDGNGRFDDNLEPSVVSTESGNYSFEFTEEQASCVPYSTMYVEVPVGAIDEDSGVVTQAYQMSSPPSITPLSDDDIRNISPLTSIIWDQFKRKFKSNDKDNLSCAELKSDINLRNELKEEIESVILTLVSHYNLSADQIYSDFIAKGDTAAYDLAQTIVTGMKASYKHKVALEKIYPTAEIRVVIYQDNKMDEEYKFSNVWYRDAVVFLDDGSLFEMTKLFDTGSLDKVDVVLMKLRNVAIAWGDPSLDGKLNIREDTYRDPDGTYRCSNIESVTFDSKGIRYVLGNIAPSMSFPTIDECVNNNFDKPEQRYFSVRFTEGDSDFYTSFFFRDDAANFTTLSHWINVKDKAAVLKANELISMFDSFPYRFDDPVNISYSYWRKSKTLGNVIIRKDDKSNWVKSTSKNDGTSVYQCSSDGVNWVACSG